MLFIIELKSHLDGLSRRLETIHHI